MGILSRSYQKRAQTVPLALSNPDSWGDVFTTNRASSGVSVTPRKSLGLPELWRGVNLIADDVMKLPLDLYRADPKAGRVKATEHPSHRAVSYKANRFVSARSFRHTLTVHAVWLGNGYAGIFRDQRDRLDSLVILDPFSTFPFQAGGELWYRTMVGSQERKLPAADVLHIKGLSIDGLCGVSLPEYLADALGLPIAARDFASKFFAQGTTASGVLMVPGHLKREAQENAMKYWQKIASGLSEAHKVALLGDGVKWQPVSVDPRQSQMVELRQFETRQIANIIGVPPHKLGDNSRVSYNSIESENLSYLNESLGARLMRWEDECDVKFLSEEEHAAGYYFEFNRGALVQADLSTRNRAYRESILGGWRSVNEVRAMENLPSIGPQGDTYLLPLNMAPADKFDDPDPGTDEPRAVSDVVRLAHRDLIRDRVELLLGIEQKQIRDAAAKGGNFLAAVERCLSSQEDKLIESLYPAVRAWGSVAGTGDPRGEVVLTVADYVEGHKRELLEAAGRSTAEELRGNVEAVVAKWPGGPVEEFVGKLMGG